MKNVKKIFNVEYDLSSADFIAQKQDQVSQEYQDRNPNDIVKVTTFCVPDKAIVVSTTQENVDFMGAAGRMLATRPLEEQSFLTMDDDMVKTYEITITANTDLPDYVTAINIAQAKADQMFKDDDSKMPLVTVIDYRWGNVPTTLTSSIFTKTDEDGNAESLIGDTKDNVVVGDAEEGDKVIKEMESIIDVYSTNNIGILKDGKLLATEIDEDGFISPDKDNSTVIIFGDITKSHEFTLIMTPNIEYSEAIYAHIIILNKDNNVVYSPYRLRIGVHKDNHIRQFWDSTNQISSFSDNTDLKIPEEYFNSDYKIAYTITHENAPFKIVDSKIIDNYEVYDDSFYDINNVPFPQVYISTKYINFNKEYVVHFTDNNRGFKFYLNEDKTDFVTLTLDADDVKFKDLNSTWINDYTLTYNDEVLSLSPPSYLYSSDIITLDKNNSICINGTVFMTPTNVRRGYTNPANSEYSYYINPELEFETFGLITTDDEIVMHDNNFGNSHNILFARYYQYFNADTVGYDADADYWSIIYKLENGTEIEIGGNKKAYSGYLYNYTEGRSEDDYWFIIVNGTKYTYDSDNNDYIGIGNAYDSDENADLVTYEDGIMKIDGNEFAIYNVNNYWVGHKNIVNIEPGNGLFYK